MSAILGPGDVGFNLKHPELLNGEMFLTNVFEGMPDFDDDEDDGSLEYQFRSIGWASKRLGNQAYDIRGNPLPTGHPVFVKMAELEHAGVV